jgi:hypothetical protein
MAAVGNWQRSAAVAAAAALRLAGHSNGCLFAGLPADKLVHKWQGEVMVVTVTGPDFSVVSWLVLVWLQLSCQLNRHRV